MVSCLMGSAGMRHSLVEPPHCCSTHGGSCAPGSAVSLVAASVIFLDAISATDPVSRSSTNKAMLEPVLVPIQDLVLKLQCPTKRITLAPPPTCSVGSTLHSHGYAVSALTPNSSAAGLGHCFQPLM
ncbi:hypothetical protein AOLI_G00152030 [Acnodon oligacanthus]